uniref:Uncharacterized protein n=1 Tax=viral metagenome TaxID=1070528 RepID=A0A6C0J9P4_9ZZZZ
MTILNAVTSMIVYTPLILVCLTVLYGIGYGVWYYRTHGSLPPSYQAVSRTFLYILKQIIKPIIALVQLLWWLFPIDKSLFGYDSWRESLGFSPLGAWSPENRIRTIGILILVSIITVTSLVLKHGYPNTIVGYSKFLNGTLLTAAIVVVLGIFIIFNKTIMDTGLDNNPWPNVNYGDLPERQRKWTISTAGTYLYYSIGVGLLLGILFTLFYLIINYGLFSVGGMNMLMIVSVIAGIVVAYNMLSSNDNVRTALNRSEALSSLFYLVFIIPCLFGDTVKYIFNQVRHTPRTAYLLLGGEILVITLYFVIPMLQKYFYILMPSKNNNSSIINSKIQSIKKNQIIIKERIKRIKNFTASSVGFGKGKNKPIPLVPEGKIIDETGWVNIISNNLNNLGNEKKLTNLLINYGYISSSMCADNPYETDKSACTADMKKAIKYIQVYTIELVGLETKLIDSEEDLKNLEIELKRANNLQKSKVLLREPVYLKNKKFIGNFEEERLNNFEIEYNYNYALSGWFFFRANSLKSTCTANIPGVCSKEANNKSILNYGDKPNIMYNSIENKLKIKMNNGKDKKPIIYIIDDVPLQKWVNVVVNYDGGVLDIFMDSKLLASFNNVVPYMSQDQITIGDTGGVSGGVCNVVYFPQSISKERIDINYKILSNKNPPIV